MSSLAMTKGAGVFKTGIAVAPVTNWRFYDTVYTERYLQTPQLNASGYDNNSPSTYAANLSGNFLLIHGTGDDNVHFQNTEALVNRLVARDTESVILGLTLSVTRYASLPEARHRDHPTHDQRPSSA